MRRSTVLALSAASVVLIAGCGSGSTPAADAPSASRSGIALDLGTTTVRPEGQRLSIALFLAGTNNSFLQNNIAGAKAEAERLGATVDIFDGKFDPTVQFNQMQTALVSKRHNAWIIQANDAQLVCDITTKQAPAAGILVSAITLPLCGRNSNSGDGLWAPGTLNFVGGSGTYPVIKAWMEKVVAANPGPRKVALVAGPELNAVTITMQKAYDDVHAEHPEFVSVGRIVTDYSVPSGLAKTQPFVVAHPDLDIVLSISPITQGVVQGLKAAGMANPPKVYDIGGSTWGVEALKGGEIEWTVPVLPRSQTTAAVRSLFEAWSKGARGERYIQHDGATVPAGTPELVIVDRSNLAGFTPEYS